jgi:hypothetical protein
MYSEKQGATHMSTKITTRFEVVYRPWSKDFAVIEWTNAKASPPEFRVVDSATKQQDAREICAVLQENHNQELYDYFVDR